MVQISLVFVGAALILNGIAPLLKLQKKTLVMFNALVGGMIIIFNLYGAMTNSDPKKFAEYLGGLLFGFTNILIAFDLAYNLDKKIMGIYSLFSTIVAVCLAFFYFSEAKTLLAVMWLIWMTIWLAAFVGGALTPKAMPFVYGFYIAHGLFSTFMVGMLMIAGILIL